jgi:uncharacterized phosphosugar-binding protein
MTDYMDQYYSEAGKLFSLIQEYEKENIQKTADLLSSSIGGGGIAHIFGTGHSAMTCREVFTRAGTLSCIRPIGLSLELDKFERLEGMAAVLLADYDFRSGEVLIVVSASGMNPLPIEIAMIAKQRGTHIVAITSLEHTRQVKSRHSSGKKLFELADIVIDTHTPAGDAAIQIPSLPMKVGPLSTIANIAIINAIVIETANRLAEKGIMPPIRVSRNMPGGDEHNQRFKELYGVRIPELKR